MNYFSELLESYSKLKKRTYKITYISEDSQAAIPSEQAAKAAVKAKAGKVPDYAKNMLHSDMYGLQAVLPPLVEAGSGQVVVQTSATGEKPQPTLMAYSTMRAAANMMCRCAAMTVAPKGVTVNVVGTNFMNYPGFWHAAVPDGNPKAIQKILDTIPMGRLGETEEAAHFTLALLDGHNMYTTGNFFPVTGGFNNAGMEPFGA